MPMTTQALMQLAEQAESAMQDRISYISLINAMMSGKHACVHFAVALSLQEAESDAIPVGPQTLPELFAWADYNARIMFQDQSRLSRFRQLAECDIEIYDSYSGTGNGSVGLKQQYAALCAAAGAHMCLL